MVNALKRFALRYFSPYNIEFLDKNWGEVTQTLHAWTEREALEWAACSLREEAVRIRKTANIFESRVVMYRGRVTEA
jgi:hypothetical protein